jgi:hypothetical protein
LDCVIEFLYRTLIPTLIHYHEWLLHLVKVRLSLSFLFELLFTRSNLAPATRAARVHGLVLFFLQLCNLGANQASLRLSIVLGAKCQELSLPPMGLRQEFQGAQGLRVLIWLLLETPEGFQVESA